MISPTLGFLRAWRGMVRDTRTMLHHTLVLTVSLDWALPDQLVFRTVSSLLWLATAHPQLRGGIIKSILGLAAISVRGFGSESGMCTGTLTEED